MELTQIRTQPSKTTGSGSMSESSLEKHLEPDPQPMVYKTNRDQDPRLDPDKNQIPRIWV